MKKSISVIITFLVIIGVIVFAFAIIRWKSASIVSEAASEEVSKWIGEHATLFVQTGCSHCEEQEALFGENVKYLKIIDCIEVKELCILTGIQGTPTWIIDGEKYVGVKTIEELKELTGYQE